MRNRNALVSGLTFKDEKEKFDRLTSDNDMTLSEGLHRLVVWANKTGKIPK